MRGVVMGRYYKYGLILILFQLTGCFEQSIYRDNTEFAPREYYRNQLTLEEAGYFSSSLEEKMKKEITADPLVRHAVVSKQGAKYIVAIKVKAYQYKKAKKLSIRYKQYWENKWKVPVEVTYQPNNYREAQK
jgi:hypothetical protein